MLGPRIFALGTSQNKHLPFLDVDLKGSLSWVPRAILAFRDGALSWGCGVYSLSDQWLNQDPECGSLRELQVSDLVPCFPPCETRGL